MKSRGILFAVLLGAILSYCAGWIYLKTQGDQATFAPSPSSYTSEQCQFLDLPGGKKIAFLWSPQPGAQLTLLYSHGSAVDLGRLKPQIAGFNKLGLNVIVYDYPGIGLSTGPLSEEDCYRAIESIYKWLRTQQAIPADQIVLYGRSVGTGPTLFLAGQEPCAAAVAVSPFTSALGVHWSTAIFGVKKFPNEEFIAEVRCPLLLVHGETDKNIPIENARKLLESAPEGAQFVAIPNFGHADLDHSPMFWGSLASFLGISPAE